MRSHGTRSDGKPFDKATIEAVWQKGEPEPYATFRKDVCGASMHRPNYGKQERWGWEIDHIKPVSMGGTDDLSNLRPLQWENSRAKADSYPDSAWTCAVSVLGRDMQTGVNFIDLQKIGSIIQSRASQLSKDLDSKLPAVLKRQPIYWATVNEQAYLMIVFLSEADERRIEGFRSRGLNPFLGLITTGSEPAAFKVEKSRYMTIDNCRVNNLFTFSLGKDSTIILVNHSQSIETRDIGNVSYTIELAYILSYGDDINDVTVYDYLDGLLAFSENRWSKLGA